MSIKHAFHFQVQLKEPPGKTYILNLTLYYLAQEAGVENLFTFIIFYRRLNSLAPKYLTDLSLQTVTSTIQEVIRI